MSTDAHPRARAPFALLRFAAAPLSAELAVVELEGRFEQGGRFARRPILVLDGAHRLELAPVRSTLTGEHWAGTYAVPAGALDDGVRFALQLRGAVLDLPAPDVAEGADRFTALAREANAMRRALEEAETVAEALRTDLAAAGTAHEEALAAARAEAEATLGVAHADHAAALSAMQAEHEAALGKAQADHVAALGAMQAQLAAATAQAQAEREAHGEELEAARAQAASSTAEAHDVAALRDQLDGLRAEQRELRKQLRTAHAELDTLRHAPGLSADRVATEIVASVTDPVSLAPVPADTIVASMAPVDDDRPTRIVTPRPGARSHHEAVPHVGPVPVRWIALASLVTFFLVVLLLLFVH